MLAALLLPALPATIHAQDTSVDDEIRQQLDADTDVQEELQQAEALARGETDETQGCGKFLGVCWYLSIPALIIVIALLGTAYSNKRNRTSP